MFNMEKVTTFGHNDEVLWAQFEGQGSCIEPNDEDEH
jgi:hypothetical protein